MFLSIPVQSLSFIVAICPAIYPYSKDVIILNLSSIWSSIIEILLSYLVSSSQMVDLVFLYFILIFILFLISFLTFLFLEHRGLVTVMSYKMHRTRKKVLEQMTSYNMDTTC